MSKSINYNHDGEVRYVERDTDELHARFKDIKRDMERRQNREVQHAEVLSVLFDCYWVGLEPAE